MELLLIQIKTKMNRILFGTKTSIDLCITKLNLKHKNSLNCLHGFNNKKY